jgi:hypothetical protein
MQTNTPICHDDGSIIERLLDRIISAFIMFVMRPSLQYSKFLFKIAIYEWYHRYNREYNVGHERGDDFGKGGGDTRENNGWQLDVKEQ